MIYTYAVVWTIGGNTDTPGRKQFSIILKETLKKVNNDLNICAPFPYLNNET